MSFGLPDWWLVVFVYAGFAVWAGMVALLVAGVVPDRAAAVHRTGRHGWWRRWKAHNKAIAEWAAKRKAWRKRWSA